MQGREAEAEDVGMASRPRFSALESINLSPRFPIKGTTSQFHSSTHLCRQPFLIDVAECDAPGLIDGSHQPDIFLE